jgi:SAM-dependent methyltransferase
LHDRLDRAAESYRPAASPDEAVLAMDREWIDAHLRGPRVLEMGCSDGTSTRMLLDRPIDLLHVVEGVAVYCEMTAQAISDSRLTIFNSLYEDFSPSIEYDDVVIARSLDYVDNPVMVLQHAATWLAPGGRLHIVVQNAESVHRRVGLELGLMPTIDHLNEASRRVGHQRVYTKAALLNDIHDAGLTVSTFGGFLLKPFDFESLSRLDFDLANNLLPALMEVGRGLPDVYCCQLYALCEPGGATPSR